MAMVSEGAAVAATEGKAAGLLASAALALPLALVAGSAGAFETLKVGVKYLDYVENGRMRARSPLLYADWAPDADTQIHFSGDVDTISGASPQYVSNRGGRVVHAMSGASIRDKRHGKVFRGAHTFGETTLGLAVSDSRENDWDSTTVSADARFDFNERNTTLAIGFGHTGDRIGASTDSSLREKRSTNELLIGVTQLLTPRSLIQSNLTRSFGDGYYNDPYKYTLSFMPGRAPVVHDDQRPKDRQQWAWLNRYRHYLPAIASAASIDYRYYRDDWGIRAHTFDLALSHELSAQWRVEPSLRYYTQGEARFFANSFAGSTGDGSSDARLAAFGAWTAALKLAWSPAPGTTFDLSVARYRQAAGYRPGGGTDHFPELDARIVMVGLSHDF